MGANRQNNEDQPLYQHQLEAILRRVKFEDLAAIGALWRVGYRKPKEVEASTLSVRKRSGADAGRVVDFNIPSPLTGRDRQGGDRRVPHVSIKPIQATGPRIKGERLLEGKGRNRQRGAQHIDYLAAGAKVTIGSHLDYLRRQFESHDPFGDLHINMRDEQVMRDEQNRLSYYSNIPGGIERHKSLFDAAERCEPGPKRFHLQVHTEALAALEELVEANDASFLMQRMFDRLRSERAKRKAITAAKGRRFKEFRATVASGSRSEVTEWLRELKDHPRLKGRVSGKPGRAGRVQFRMVFELPVGLSAVERHAVMRDFCNKLGDDGHMFVAAIHQPDRTNDKRNYHIHVDLYDRPAKWLDDHGLWDFEYKVRRNGKDTYPLRQNKVRYSQPPARLFRERYIEIVEGIRNRREHVAKFLMGTYTDNGIDLTPLDHMGPRAIGLEKRGVVTAVGTENARRIISDEIRHAEKRARTEYWKETEAVLQTFRSAKRDGHASDALFSFIDLRKKIADRRLQAELGRITVRMKRSRADAVIRTLTPEPGRPVVSQKGDVALLEKARAHVAWIESHAPSEDMIAAEQRLLDDLAKAAAKAKAKVLAVCSEPTVGQSVAIQDINEADVSTAGKKQTKPSQFDELKRQRLHSWLDEHIEDPAYIRMEPSAFLRGERMPKAIHTLMKQFAREPEFLDRFETERARRSSLPSPTAGVVEQPVSRSLPTSPSLDSEQTSHPKLNGSRGGLLISTSAKPQSDVQSSRNPSGTINPASVRGDHGGSPTDPERHENSRLMPTTASVKPEPHSSNLVHENKATAAQLTLMHQKIQARKKRRRSPDSVGFNRSEQSYERDDYELNSAGEQEVQADRLRRAVLKEAINGTPLVTTGHSTGQGIQPHTDPDVSDDAKKDDGRARIEPRDPSMRKPSGSDRVIGSPRVTDPHSKRETSGVQADQKPIAATGPSKGSPPLLRAKGRDDGSPPVPESSRGHGR